MSSIPTLLNMCLDFVSDNLYALSAIYISGNNFEIYAAKKLNTLAKNTTSEGLHFRNDIFFPENIADKLITLLSKKGKLNDDTMKLFERETTRLRHVDIPNASEISKNGLLTMKDHKLIDLKVHSSKLPMNDIVRCLNEYNLENAQTLSFSRNPPKEQ